MAAVLDCIALYENDTRKTQIGRNLEYNKGLVLREYKEFLNFNSKDKIIPKKNYVFAPKKWKHMSIQRYFHVALFIIAKKGKETKRLSTGK